MMLGMNAPKAVAVPFWNEIKNLSREDRSNLHDLLEVSLLEEQNEKSDIDNFLGQIDEDALKAAAEFAYKESKAGHCIPNSQVFESIMEEMGWK